ncbi:MAG TPA: dockerin type I domain-containing protein, partial [Phycisphaerae bacterium]|nr:dockerin type I domain-containing protein [Phycisphaerae bacterium]
FVYDADANTFVANVAFGTPGHPGDFNCDGAVNTLDVAAAALRLTDPTAYATQYPGCGDTNADVNGDGSVNGLDLQRFVTILLGG